MSSTEFSRISSSARGLLIHFARSSARSHQVGSPTISPTSLTVKKQAERQRRVIRLLLGWQLVAAIMFGVAGYVLTDRIGGMSALLGGLICWLPNCWFAFRAFRHRGARAARQIVRSFYAGEAGKMLLTVVFFAIVFINVKSVNALALFAGFAGVQLINWIVPLMVARADHRQNLR